MSKETRIKENYCRSCHFFKIDSDYEYYYDEYCVAPQNKVTDKSYAKKNTILRREPEEINRKNNCKWFKSLTIWDRFFTWRCILGYAFLIFIILMISIPYMVR